MLRKHASRYWVLAALLILAIAAGGCTSLGFPRAPQGTPPAKGQPKSGGTPSPAPTPVPAPVPAPKPVSQPVVSTKLVVDKKPELDANFKIPVFSGLDDKALESKLNADFTKQATDWQNEMMGLAKQGAAEAKANKYPFRQYSAYMDYRVTYNQNGLFSMAQTMYQYTGGAHGGTAQISYTIDLRTGKTLKLADLFKQGADYQTFINTEIARQIAANPEGFFPPGNNGFKAINPEHPFYIADAGIVLHFSQYEIAPYSSGMPTFIFPVAKLKDIIDPMYAAAITSRYETGSGRTFQVKSYKVEANTPDSARIVFEVVPAGDAWDNMNPQVKVLTENDSVYLGEGKSKDPSLGKFRAELLFSDAGLQKAMRDAVGLKTQQIAAVEPVKTQPQASTGKPALPPLVQAFRVAYPPDDTAMVFYLGCSVKPKVTVTEDYGKLIVELKKQ